MNKYHGLKLSDNFLMMLLNSAVSSVSPFSVPNMAETEKMTEIFSVQPTDFDEMKDGQEIYKIWQELTETAEEQKACCFKVYNDSCDRMLYLENRINECYTQSDALTSDYNEFMAKKEACDKKIRLVQKSIDEMNGNIVSLTEKIEKLEKDKEVYDILRWVPVVNLISEIIAAVEGTRDELQAKKRELEKLKDTLRQIYCERNKIISEIAEVERKLSENEIEKKKLQQEREACQKQRNTASHEMIDWKEREKYYLEVEKKMEHLIEIEADVEEFKKLLADNPPKFQIAS